MSVQVSGKLPFVVAAMLFGLGCCCTTRSVVAEEPAYDSTELCAPVRLEADGAPIDIGKLSNIAHAGPWIADVDCDGDRDLLVGDFPGHFWFFDNIGNDEKPEYKSRGMLKAGGELAKTPVY